MLLNVSNPKPVPVNGGDLQTTEELTYLGSIVRHDWGAGSDIKNPLNKARNAFRMLNNVCRSFQYSTKTKLNKMLKDAKASYYSSIISENASDPKVLFNAVDKLLHCKVETLSDRTLDDWAYKQFCQLFRQEDSNNKNRAIQWSDF